MRTTCLMHSSAEPLKDTVALAVGAGREWGREFVFKDWTHRNEHQDTHSLDKLLWAVCAAVVISGEGPEDTFLHSALVSGKREDFSGVSEDRWLILAV